MSIYRDDLAMISEVRTIDVPAGRSKIVFKNVSDLIIPQTAVLREFGAITIERNFDFNLLTQQALLEASVGKEVWVTRRNPATGAMIQTRGRVLSASNGTVLDIDGQIEAYECSGLPESITFDAMPEGLNPVPTLSLEVSAEKAGPQEVILSYLTSGFSWSADYIMTLKGEDEAALLGWLTLRNETSMSFENADLQVIAGNIQRLGDTYGEGGDMEYFRSYCWKRGSTKRGSPVRHASMVQNTGEMLMRDDSGDEIVVTASRLASGSLNAEMLSLAVATEEDLGDYKLYRPQEPTNLNAHQTKQVAFLFEDAVEFEKVFTLRMEGFRNWDQAPRPANIEFRPDNSRQGKLARSLPAGTFRIMDTGSTGLPYLAGADDIRDLAVDLPVKLKLGQAPGIQIQSSYKVVEDADQDAEKQTAVYLYTHRISNAYNAEATVRITHAIFDSVDVTFSGNEAFRDESEPYPTWVVTVPAEGQAELTYHSEKHFDSRITPSEFYIDVYRQ